MIVYGLIGYPLSHSFSENYFKGKFLSEDLHDHDYRLFPLPDLSDLPSILDTPGLAGLNVTIPYKKAIIPYLDEMDQNSEEIGAVNTIKIIRGDAEGIRLAGFNTDTEGFRDSADFTGHRMALVLGTGGASAAVRFALKNMGIRAVPVSRQPQPFNYLLYSDLTREIIEEHTLIINATPLGMYPDVHSFPPIPYEYLTEKHFVYDLVYNPGSTVFLEKAAKQGALVMNGLKMLYLQAEYSWKIWNSH